MFEKIYVFFTGNITNMGGAQLYLSNKCTWLKKQGFDVRIYSVFRGTVLLDNLLPYKKYIIPEMIYRPSLMPKKTVIRYVNTICEEIREYKEIYIESTVVELSEWAEIVSTKLACEHICINLQENHDYDYWQRCFLEFKYDNDQLYGITKESIGKILKRKDLEIDKHYIYAPAVNAVEDVKYDSIDSIIDCDYCIGTIGRLGKRYLIKSLADIIEFSQKHKEKSISLVLIGDDTIETKKKIHSLIDPVDNIRLTITGLMYPIPRRLIKAFDCCFACSGSSIVSAMEGIPTVRMSVDTGNALGILEYTVGNSNYDEKEGKTLLDYLEMILIDKYCETHEKEYAVVPPSINDEYSKQLGYFHPAPYRYFDISQIKPIKARDKMYKYMISVFGVRIFHELRSNALHFRLR